MSLASAQRALAKANRDTLQKSAKGKIAGGLIEGAADLATDTYDLANEAFDFEGNKNAWEDYAAGQEYLGIENPNKPMKRSQRYLKRPGEVYEGSVELAGRNKSFTAGEMGSIGSLARSDMRSTYENILGGDLASKVGTPYSALAEPKINNLGGDIPSLGTFQTPDETLSEQKTASDTIGKGLVPTDVKTDSSDYEETMSSAMPSSKLAPISTQSLTDEWKNTKVANDKSFKDKGLTHGGSGLGSRKGNIAVEKALKEKGIKGKGLSNMIPGWGGMEYEERMEAIQALGVGAEEMWAKLNTNKK